MAVRRRSKRRSSNRRAHVHKPAGSLSPRVQKVGPECFGMVCVDPHKGSSKWMMTDYYARILVPPTVLEHRGPQLRAAVEKIHSVSREHKIADCLVVIERTGQYHLPVQRAFNSAGFETRIIHPFATKQYRQVADPGNKTDDNDLAAIQRGAVAGFGLTEAQLPAVYRQLQLLTRYRRDLVGKSSALRCQVREHLGCAMPGYAELFDKFFESETPLWIARQTGSAQAILDQSIDTLATGLRQAGVRHQRRTLEKILAWARTAPPADPQSVLQKQIWISLDDDRQQKYRQIRDLEVQIASYLVQTPYLLLLAIPGINIVSVADLAGEMGPISHYANANTITGRAGLFPARYQSNRVDHNGGPLVRCANRRLRAALMMIADNLLRCNNYFRIRSQEWQLAGKDPRHQRVRIAKTFTRLAYALVAGGQLFRHRCMQPRGYMLEKLLAFYHDHQADMSKRLADIDIAILQIPTDEYKSEAQRLQTQPMPRGRGPTSIGQILPIVLAKLVGDGVQSEPSGDQDSG